MINFKKIACLGFFILLGALNAYGQSASLEDSNNASIQAYSRCLNDRAKKTAFVDPDAISSAIILMRACKPSWNAYLRTCLASGKDGDTCAFLGVGLARSSADLKGEDLPMFQFGLGGGLPSIPSGPWTPYLK
ncbi:hypothetical protein [Acidisoma silvae]|uniref:Uncharacterized protein n=1 Tax=Acidisoma silvae TaxID=2802396 RepID=A0A963YX26_9PROT|nr:hypothetical protein [Acidisoma silvae]MCB8878424.1 hypothetical protein [Acidisoma silvae]